MTITTIKTIKIAKKIFAFIFSASLMLFSSCGRLLDEVLNLDPRDGGDVNDNKKSGIWTEITDDLAPQKKLSISMVEKNGYFEFSATEGFSAYTWKLDGIDLNATGSRIIVKSASAGYHTISVEATDSDGKKYFSSCSMRKTESTTDKSTSIIIFNDLIPSNPLSITADETNGTIQFSATTGFSSYAWKLDGVDKNTTGARITVNSISAGYHTISVEAIDSNDKKYFASCSLRKTESASDKTVSIIISNDVDTTNPISISATENGGALALSASEGFSSYEWKIDGVDLDITSATANVSLAHISQGYHIVSVETTDSNGKKHFTACSFRKINSSSDETIKIEIVNDSVSKNPLSITETMQSDTMEFSATKGFSSYTWSIDGIVVDSKTSKASVSLANFSIGYHTVSVEAVDSSRIKQFATHIYRKTGN